MKSTLQLALLAALAVPALAQSNPEPRTARALPFQPDVKVDAAVEPAPATTVAAPERAAAPASAHAAGARRKPFDGDASRSSTPASAIDRLFWTSLADGSTWVSGRTFKARFGADGATYVPFLGSSAPRNFPLELSLASASVGGEAIPLAPAAGAVRDGDRVVIDRGPIDEVYEVGLESIEQTFVVGERPGDGDLRFVVGLASEMARAESADGVTFSNELGQVRYGRAFVREADGRRVPVASRLVEGGVEIVVGRDYLAGASFPLVVDPVISTFTLDNVAYDSVESDVAYDVSYDRQLVVYERVFSASDGDVYAILREGNGSNSYFSFLDNTVENWRSPQCANLNLSNQFLMVAQVSNVTGALNRNIWGMTIDAGNFVNSFKFLISAGDATHEHILADVGGDGYDGPGASYYCVAWQRNFNAGDTDIHARLVTAQGTLVGTSAILVDNSGASIDSWPSVSKSNGTLGGAAAWTIAWHRFVAGTDYDVRAARLAWDGIVLNASTPIVSGSGTDYYPRAASPLADGRSVLVYAHDYSTDHDLEYALLSGTTVQATGSLTQLDASSTLYEDQIEYSVDSDGERVLVVYAESYAGSSFDYDIWASTFAPFGSGLDVAEAHRSVDFTGAQSLRTDVVAHRSGGAIGSPRFYLSWDSTYGVQHDLYAGIFDRLPGGGYQTYCYGDGSGTACPCGNSGGFQRGCANSQIAAGAGLAATGNAQTNGGDTVSFAVDGVPANVTCTLFQGTGANTTLFGDGVRCVSGTQIRIRSKFASASGTASWPTGAEADVSVTGMIPAGGAVRFYQVSYRNSASFCTPATFNISNGVRVLWLP